MPFDECLNAVRFDVTDVLPRLMDILFHAVCNLCDFEDVNRPLVTSGDYHMGDVFVRIASACWDSVLWLCPSVGDDAETGADVEQ